MASTDQMAGHGQRQAVFTYLGLNCRRRPAFLLADDITTGAKGWQG